MTTAAIPGFLTQVYISVDGGTNYNPIAELRDVSLDVKRDTLDASSHNDQGWKANIPGLAQFTMSANSLYIRADAVQSALYAALINRTTFKARYYPKGNPATSGDEYWQGDAIMTSWKLGGPNSDVAATDIEILGSGALTLNTIP